MNDLHLLLRYWLMPDKYKKRVSKIKKITGKPKNKRVAVSSKSARGRLERSPPEGDNSF